MKRLKPIEITGIYLAIGFFTGLIVSFVVSIIVVDSVGGQLTVVYLNLVHKAHPLLFLIDASPLIGASIAFFFARSRNRLHHTIECVTADQLEKSEYIKKVIHNLTIGNLNAKIKDEVLEAEMAESLKSMQSRLKENLNTQRATRKADQQRNWTSEGLAEFGDILRSHSSNLEKLSYAVISNLVRYMDVNQGGIFIVKDTEEGKILEMTASHAYDRKKFPNTRVNWGEGLIGAVAIEKKSYYTNKLAEGYLTISSGLGMANPKYLLIVPLVLNDEVFGVFEIASFTDIHEHEIQFVERVAENTATTLNILNSNTRTEHLLKETQEQASKLAAQEERVRQNIEELKITQAEAASQSEEFVSFTNTVNHTLIRAEYNTEGKLIYANTRFLKKLGYSGNKEVEGKDVSLFIHANDREWFKEIWNRLSSGGQHYEGYMRHVTKMSLELWTMSTYTCVRKDDGGIDKVLFLAVDSTEQKEKSLYFEGQIKAINELNPKAEFSPDGRIHYYNDLFLKTLKYKEADVKNNNVFDFFAKSDQESINEIWEQVITGHAFQGQLRMLGKYEEEVWFRAAFTVVEDMYGEVDKVVFLAYEITKEKELEISMLEQNEKLREKEDELRIQSIDLKRQLTEANTAWNSEKNTLLQEAKKYSDVLDIHPTPILAVNNQGFVTIFNKAAVKFWKLSKKAVLHNKADLLLSHDQQHDAIKAFLEPGKQVIEIKSEVLSITLADKRELDRKVSIFENELGSEKISVMIIHS